MDMSRIPHQERHRACDPCRRRKIKCSRESPCRRCSSLELNCVYSPTKPLGRPRQPEESSMDIGPPPLAPAALPETNGFVLESSSQMDAILTSGPMMAANMPVPESVDTLPWYELMNISGTSPDHIHFGESLESPSRDTPSTSHPSVGSTGASTVPHPTPCSCMEFAHEQLNEVENSSPRLSSIKVLRRSMMVAEKVMSCNICFSTNRRPSEVSGNSQLLGSLLLATTACWADVIKKQQQKAARSTHEAGFVKFFIGQDAGADDFVELSLGGIDYCRLLDNAFHSDLDRLSTICETFSARQHQIHEQGHENCLPGGSCKKLYDYGLVIHPMDACPRKSGVKYSFTCYRTANQVRAEIENMRKTLRDEANFGEVFQN